MAQSSSMKYGNPKPDYDADYILPRKVIKKSSGSLEVFLLGLLSAGIGILLFLVFFKS